MNGNDGRKAVFEWGGLFLYGLISVCWFAFSLVLQEINSEGNFKKVQDAIKAISCKLCIGVRGDGYPDIPQSVPNVGSGVQKAPGLLWEASATVRSPSEISVLVYGVPRTGCATLSPAVHWQNPNEGDCLVLALVNGWISECHRRDQCEKDQGRDAWLRDKELWAQGEAEGRAE